MIRLNDGDYSFIKHALEMYYESLVSNSVKTFDDDRQASNSLADAAEMCRQTYEKVRKLQTQAAAWER